MIFNSTDVYLTQEDIEFEAVLDDNDSEGEFPEGLELYKMVLVVNASLNMGAGKIGAQCAHAALALHRMMIERSEVYGEMMLSWEQYG